MKEDIPFDGLGSSDTLTGQDTMSLLILRQAFIDATENAFGDEKTTDEQTDDYIDEYTGEKE